jgi:hypothetical protein
MNSMVTIGYLFTDEELADIKAAADEHQKTTDELIRQAVLEALAA